MSNDTRKRRDGSRARRSTDGALPQLPWRDVRNPYRPLDVLAADQLEAIHRTSLRILGELGIELMSPQRARNHAGLRLRDGRSPPARSGSTKAC